MKINFPLWSTMWGEIPWQKKPRVSKDSPVPKQEGIKMCSLTSVASQTMVHSSGERVKFARKAVLQHCPAGLGADIVEYLTDNAASLLGAAVRDKVDSDDEELLDYFSDGSGTEEMESAENRLRWTSLSRYHFWPKVARTRSARPLVRHVRTLCRDRFDRYFCAGMALSAHGTPEVVASSGVARPRMT